jgi:hypothetical protein
MSPSSNTSPPQVSQGVTLTAILVRTAVAHTVTYFLIGILAAFILDYASAYSGPTVRLLMRQTSDPLVMGGPLFQPIRGVSFWHRSLPAPGSVFRPRSWIPRPVGHTGDRRHRGHVWTGARIAGGYDLHYTANRLSAPGPTGGASADVFSVVACLLLGAASRKALVEPDPGNRVLPVAARARARAACQPTWRALSTRSPRPAKSAAIAPHRSRFPKSMAPNSPARDNVVISFPKRYLR